MRFKVLFVALLLFSCTPLFAHAGGIPFFGPIIPKESATCPASWGLVITVINNIITLLITLAIVFVAPLMIAYAGFLFVVNPVNSGGISQAKSILLNTVIGIAVALAGWLIVDAIMAVLYNPTAVGSTWSSLITSGGTTPCLQVAGSYNPAKPVTPPVVVPPTIPTGPLRGFNIPLAVAKLNAQASPTYNADEPALCAQYVRQAIAAGGLSQFNSPQVMDNGQSANAKDYGPFLIRAGFQTVPASGYSPIAGDIKIFDAVSGHPFGHIQMYNGTRWVSNYMQNSEPPPAYASASYTIYRWPGDSSSGGGSGGDSCTADPSVAVETVQSSGQAIRITLPGGIGKAFKFNMPDATAQSQAITVETAVTNNEGLAAPHEVSISKCPGDFSGTCRYDSNGTGNSIGLMTVNDITSCNLGSSGIYYANFRFTDCIQGSCEEYIEVKGSWSP